MPLILIDYLGDARAGRIILTEKPVAELIVSDACAIGSNRYHRLLPSNFSFVLSFFQAVSPFWLGFVAPNPL